MTPAVTVLQQSVSLQRDEQGCWSQGHQVLPLSGRRVFSGFIRGCRQGLQAAVCLQPCWAEMRKGIAKNMGTDTSRQAQPPAEEKLCPYGDE